MRTSIHNSLHYFMHYSRIVFACLPEIHISDESSTNVHALVGPGFDLRGREGADFVNGRQALKVLTIKV